MAPFYVAIRPFMLAATIASSGAYLAFCTTAILLPGTIAKNRLSTELAAVSTLQGCFEAAKSNPFHAFTRTLNHEKTTS